MSNDIEKQGAEMLLDLGVRIPVLPLRFLRIKRRGHVTLHRPYLGTLLRISLIYSKIGVKYEDMKNYDYDDNVRFVAEHGKDVSKMVACAITCTLWKYKLFNNIVAWWLRWHVHPVYLAEAFYQVINLTDFSPFQDIIHLSSLTNPLRRSQKEKRS